ncbi:MAG: hypothetical protein LBJ00_02125 [Planctomycetaceae bacterium]|jgi:hypothetical protein|nr:hypothetical protein [Planctomycetaceae bacterium]
MTNDIKQPIAFSFQDYRDEAIVDFFANENRPFRPDVSSGRLRLVGSSRLEVRPTVAFRASSSFTDKAKGVSADGLTETIDNRQRNSKSTPKTSTPKISTKFPRTANFPKTNTLKSNAQLKSPEIIGVVSLVNKGENVLSSAGEVSEWIEAALSKPTHSLASLSKADRTSIVANSKDLGFGIGTTDRGVAVSGVGGEVRSGKGIKIGDLELPAVETPVLQPVLPLRDRISALKSMAAKGNDTLKLVALQVSEMRREVADVVGGGGGGGVEVGGELGEGFGLRVVSGCVDECDELRADDVVDQSEYAGEEHDSRYCYDNAQSPIKFDPNLQKLVQAWSWLPEAIKETIVSVVAVAEKEKT